MPEDKNKNVRDLTMRRQKQLQKTDPVVILADEMTKLVASHANRMKPEEQLVAIELTAKALLTTLTHAHGPEILNHILVEVEHKRKQYSMQWPAHDNSPTVYDGYDGHEKPPDTEPSPVVALHPKEDETEH
jgi:hypothetical protein